MKRLATSLLFGKWLPARGPIFFVVGALLLAMIGSIVTDIMKFYSGGQPDGLWLLFAFIITSIALLVYISYVIGLFRARAAAQKRLRDEERATNQYASRNGQGNQSPDRTRHSGHPVHRERIEQLNEIRRTIRAAKGRIPGGDPERIWRLVGGALYLRLEEKKKIAQEMKQLPVEKINGLIQNLEQQALRFSRKLGADLFQTMTDAICTGRLAHYADIEGADAEALRTGNQSLRVVARLAKQGGKNQAILLKEVEKILPQVKVPHVWLLWANRIKKLADSKKRLEWAYPRMKTLGDHDAYSWNDYGNLLVEHLNRADEAEAAYYLAIELDPKLAMPWHNLGKLLKDRQRYGEAEQALRKAIEINPKYASAWVSLASLLQYKLNRIPEAAAAYRQALALDQNNAHTWNEFASLLADRLNKPAEAEKAYRRAVALNPNNPSYLNNLAWQLYLNNRGLDEAEEFSRRSVNSDSKKDLINFHTLACILMRRGIWDEAVRYARDFIRQGNDGLHKEAWPEIIMFFRDAVATGHSNEALRLINEAECSEHWRPMREALQAISRDDVSYLTNLAPELQRPVGELLNRLLPKGVKLGNPKIRQKQRAERLSYNFEADIKIFVPDQFNPLVNNQIH